MRIERLSFQAFGPYIERQDLDFQTLANHHLFLLRGPTGAGKTAILDAITYALYGKSSGGERGDFERMRCRNAASDTSTFVELIFWIHDRRYRFFREVIVGHKRTGEELYKISVQGGELIQDVYHPFFESFTKSSLDHKAEELIGLTHAQFIQVMILPQGKFEKLLVSKSEEKQEILKTLFQSERWTLICDRLSEQWRKEKAELEQVQMKMDALMANTDGQALEELKEQSLNRKQNLPILKQAVEDHQRHLQQLQKQYEEQVQLQELMQRLTTCQAHMQTLHDKQDHMEKQRRVYEYQKELHRLRPYVMQVQASEQQMKETLQRSEAVQKQLLATQEALIQKQGQKPEITAIKEQLEKGKQQLLALREQETLWSDRQQFKQNIQKQEQRLKQSMNREQQLQTQLQEGEQTVQQLQQELKQMEAVISQYPQDLEQEQWLKEAKVWLEQKEAWTQKYSMLKQEITNKQQECALMRQQEQSLQATYEAALEVYLTNSAALLSELLEEGAPCPVCGSTHHPKLAQALHQKMELQTLQEQKQRWEQRSAERQQMEVWLDQAQRQLEDLSKELQNHEQAKQSLRVVYDAHKEEQLLKHLHHSRELMQQQNTHKERLQSAVHAQEQLTATLTKAQEERRIQEQELLVMHTQCKERFAHLPQDRELQDLLEDIRKLKDSISHQEATIQTWETTVRELETKAVTLQEAARHAKDAYQNWFDATAKALSVLQAENNNQRTMEELTAKLCALESLKIELQSYDEDVNQTKRVISELQSQMQDRPLLDVKQLQIEKDDMQQRVQTALQTLLQEEQEQKRIVKLINQYEAYQKAYEALMLRHTKRSEFVKAMRGDTSIGIERYVLGIMLSSITQNANQLLKHIHDGRYQIYRSDDTSGRTRKFGLELSIYDAYSGSMRSVVSLSGGEKFLVSLALSLALSTVVQARSGGVVMESMFIDEGFGSLDEQSIADALQVLSSMANAKAMIGIISHVELLKENIPYGIDVTKAREGSTCNLLV